MYMCNMCTYVRVCVWMEFYVCFTFCLIVCFISSPDCLNDIQMRTLDGGFVIC